MKSSLRLRAPGAKFNEVKAGFETKQLTAVMYAILCEADSALLLFISLVYAGLHEKRGEN